MKRFLKNDRYQLSMREQEDVWRGIQRRSGLAGDAGPSRRRGWPVFGMTTVVAALLMAAVWLHDLDAPEKIARQTRRQVPMNSESPVMKPRAEKQLALTVPDRRAASRRPRRQPSSRVGSRTRKPANPCAAPTSSSRGKVETC